MNFEVVATGPFERKLKRLAKKYKSLKRDILPLALSLSEKPDQGTPLGKGCFKVRLAISSKGKGKSGGARVITYLRASRRTVFLLDIYDKSEQVTISDKELKLLVELLARESP